MMVLRARPAADLYPTPYAGRFHFVSQRQQTGVLAKVRNDFK